MLFDLSELLNLKRLDAGHNFIKKIEGLTKCKLLEEINLEKNLIVSVNGLNDLIFLKRIELGMNKITRIDNLGLKKHE